jgi:hypothetical protein
MDALRKATIYALVFGGPHVLFRTTNGAGSWKPVATAPSNCGALAIAPSDPSRIALAGGRVIALTDDGAATWTEPCGPLPLSVRRVAVLAFDPTGTDLRAATTGGEFVCTLPT